MWLDDPVAANGGEPLQGFEPHFLEDIFAGEVSNPLAGSGRLFCSEDMIEIEAAYVNYGTLVEEEWNTASGNGWSPLRNRLGANGSCLLPGEINPVNVDHITSLPRGFSLHGCRWIRILG